MQIHALFLNAANTFSQLTANPGLSYRMRILQMHILTIFTGLEHAFYPTSGNTQVLSYIELEVGLQDAIHEPQAT